MDQQACYAADHLVSSTAELLCIGRVRFTAYSWANMTRRNYRWIQLLALVPPVAVAAWLALSWQDIQDAYALRSFTPTAEMAQIIDHLQLTNHAKAVLYRARPQIDDKAAFNADCQTRPHELELGCYYRGRIYILRIQNDQLASEMAVVAGHELLHAVWAELGRSERTKLAQQLERVYGSLNDTELDQRMDEYATSEPGEQSNELHSILGTEQLQLPPTLEEHYARYFQHRQTVAGDHQTYEGVFAERRTQLEKDLAVIRDKKAQLAVMNKRMDGLKATAQIPAYNAMVPGQNALVDDINARIDRYQAAVQEFNALSKSLDSQLITETESPAR